MLHLVNEAVMCMQTFCPCMLTMVLVYQASGCDPGGSAAGSGGPAGPG